MKTFYAVLKVEPINGDNFPTPISMAYAFCFIKENYPNNAINKINFAIQRADFKIIKLENPPQAVKRGHFIEEQLLLEAFDRCEKDGQAILFNGIAKDGKSSSGPHEVPVKETIKYSQINSITKKIRNIGQCLHYNAGNNCSELIKAHSIQKSGLLEKISEKGHVYSVVADLQDLIKNQGKLNYKKVGINQLSTFKGFCGKHDNELFEDIDNGNLNPNSKQIMLYTYRSLCREIHTKMSVIKKNRLIEEHSVSQFAVDGLRNGIIWGNYKGLEDLLRHKHNFDKSLSNENYEDIEYVVYYFKGNPILVFSGLLFPDFDFQGNQLQDLGNIQQNLELMTFCSAPMKDGWGYMLAWHKSSSEICNKFYNSLEQLSNTQPVIDILFRLAINSENIGIKPEWWESLSKNTIQQIIDYSSESSDPFSEIRNDYLIKGLDGIVNWEIIEKIDNRKKPV